MNTSKYYIRVLVIILVCVLLTSCSETFSITSNLSTKIINISFNNSSDNITLSGTLTIPSSPGPCPVVILIHGSGPHTRDSKLGQYGLFKDIADRLAKQGIATLRYDKRGCGISGGKYEPFDIESFTSDGLSAVEYVKTQKHVEAKSIGVLGISQGGIIAPKMALSTDSIDFLVLLAPPAVWGMEYFMSSSIALARASGFNQNDFIKIENLYNEFWKLCTKDELSSKERQRAIELLYRLSHFMTANSRTMLNMNNADAYLSFIRSPNLIESMDYDPYTTLTQVECPTLALFGGKDVQTAPEENLAAIEKIANDTKSDRFTYAKIENVNHMFHTCKTGLPEEYLTIQKGISPVAIELITEFILNLNN